MIDDLVTQGVQEPYRMFTSRAEYRLTLRADNADQRLTPRGIELGVVGEARRTCYLRKAKELEKAKAILSAECFSARRLADGGFNLKPDGPSKSAKELLALPNVEVCDVLALSGEFGGILAEIAEQIGRDSLYEPYAIRQQREIEALRKDEAWPIPPDFQYKDMPGLSNELQEKLMLARPESLGQARRISGMTPAALGLILASLRRSSVKQA